jgi:redox-sensitive bicupin YhaK (pirin superfamily)
VTLAAPDGQTVGEVRVFMGSLAGSQSPVRTHTPLLGAELLLKPGAVVVLAVDPVFEHGVLAENGPALVEGSSAPHRTLAYVGPGRSSLRLANPTPDPLRLLLLGGTPFEEEITMWWNFVGRSHEEIVEYRAAWQREIGAEGAGDDGRFGPVVEFTNGDGPLPAPVLPQVRLRPRGGARERKSR